MQASIRLECGVGALTLHLYMAIAPTMRVVTGRWHIRELSPQDSFENLTELLHRAYAPLAARGLRYLASHQGVETTRRRVEKGCCFVAQVDHDGSLIGTIVVYPPASPLDHGNDSGALGPDWYRQDGVASFGQFGVDPNWKGFGIGKALHVAAEKHARSLGAREIACDTAKPAKELVAMYTGWGYRVVGETKWEVTNYESVILSKSLATGIEA